MTHDIDQKILDTAKQIDELKGKAPAGRGGPVPGADALVSEMPMAGKLSPEELLDVVEGVSLFEGKDLAAVAKMVAEDDHAREVLMKALAAAIDMGSMAEMDAGEMARMKGSSDADESEPGGGAGRGDAS